MPRGRRHLRQRGEKILVDRIALAVDALFLRHLAFQPAALLVRVVEFAKTVGELDAADIKLEALGDARDLLPSLGRARQRRQRGRILVENGGAADAEIALDALHQHAAENIAPGVVIGDADAGRLRGSSASASRSGMPSGSVASRSMPAKRANASATVSRSGSAKASAERPRKVRCRVPAARAATAQDRGAIGHQRLIGFAGAIPFDKREFGIMQRAAFAVAKHLGEFDDARARRRREASCRRIPARCADSGATPCRPAPQARWRRRADEFVARRDLQRRGLDLDEVLRRQTRPAARPRSGPAPTGPAGGRRGRAGPKRARNGAERPA